MCSEFTDFRTDADGSGLQSFGASTLTLTFYGNVLLDAGWSTMLPVANGDADEWLRSWNHWWFVQLVWSLGDGLCSSLHVVGRFGMVTVRVGKALCQLHVGCQVSRFRPDWPATFAAAGLGVFSRYPIFRTCWHWWWTNKFSWSTKLEWSAVWLSLTMLAGARAFPLPDKRGSSGVLSKGVHLW